MIEAILYLKENRICGGYGHGEVLSEAALPLVVALFVVGDCILATRRRW